MLLHAPNETRPYQLGPLPMEVLPRDEAVLARETARPALVAEPGVAPGGSPFAVAVERYRALFATLADGETAPAKAPLPNNPERLATDIKGGGYFLNASQIAVCAIPPNAWLTEAEPLPHGTAIVVIVEHGRDWARQSLATPNF